MKNWSKYTLCWRMTSLFPHRPFVWFAFPCWQDVPFSGRQSAFQLLLSSEKVWHGREEVTSSCVSSCPQELPAYGRARNAEGWISGFLLSNCVLMIWLLVILPINCPMQQNRPHESGTSSQQGRAVYRTEIRNLIILQARFSADVNMYSLTEVTGSILTSFRQGAGYLFIRIVEKILYLYTMQGQENPTLPLGCLTARQFLWALS